MGATCQTRHLDGQQLDLAELHAGRGDEALETTTLLVRSRCDTGRAETSNVMREFVEPQPFGQIRSLEEFRISHAHRLQKWHLGCTE